VKGNYLMLYHNKSMIR